MNNPLDDPRLGQSGTWLDPNEHTDSAMEIKMSEIRSRMADTEMLTEVAKWGWSNAHDGPGSDDAAWDSVTKQIVAWLNSGHVPWKQPKP